MALKPLNSQNSLSQNFGQINDMVRQLNHEQTTKVFKQAGGDAIVEGKLPFDGGYGSLYYDATNLPRILIGITPDGDVDIVKSKAGTSVLDVFN
jgi:hypothetical protein